MNAQAQKIISPVDVKKRQNLNIRTGDTVRVSLKIEEKGKTRIQVFEGLVLARKHGNEAGATFTVRRVSSGVGVEKIFTLYSPYIEDIEIIRRAKVRQANLYHIRRKATKEVRRQMKNTRVVSETASGQEGDEIIDESPEEDAQDDNATPTETEAADTNEEATTSEQQETPSEEVKEEETAPEQEEVSSENAEETKEEEVKSEK